MLVRHCPTALDFGIHADSGACRSPVLRALPGPGGSISTWPCGRFYRAGEKAFVDYAGPKFEVVDRKTGEVHDAMVFVGVLAANHTFVDVTRSRALP